MKSLLFSLALLVALLPSFGQTTFKVVAGNANTIVQFTSKATTETVVGTTHTATGSIEFDPSSSGQGARGDIHVDLSSIKTGLALRDRHMRQNQLETGKYPEAVFTLTSLTLPSGGLPEGILTRVNVKGTFSLHGVEHSIEPESYITLSNSSSGTAISVASNFTLRLADYNIKRPQFLMLRLAEEQQMTVKLFAQSSERVAAGTP